MSESTDNMVALGRLDEELWTGKVKVNSVVAGLARLLAS